MLNKFLDPKCRSLDLRKKQAQAKLNNSCV